MPIRRRMVPWAKPEHEEAHEVQDEQQVDRRRSRPGTPRSPPSLLGTIHESPGPSGPGPRKGSSGFRRVATGRSASGRSVAVRVRSGAEVAVHVGWRGPRVTAATAAIDLVLGQRPVVGGEHQPEGETASVVGQRPAAVDVEQLDRGEQRPGVAADGRLDLAAPVGRRRRRRRGRARRPDGATASARAAPPAGHRTGRPRRAPPR